MSLNIDFNIPSLKKISDEEYFKIGNIDYFNHKDLVLSASTLKNIYSLDAYDVLINKGNKTISKELKYVFDTGSAFHCYILEPNEFDKRFYIAEFKNNFEDEKRTFIKDIDFEFIVKAKKSIKNKYSYILENEEMNEIAILANIDGVPFKAKIDKLIITDAKVVIIDLKSIWFDFYSKKYSRANDGIRWGLIKEMKSLHYDLQGYIYSSLMSTYMKHNNINKEIEFKLLLLSKETSVSKMVTFGSEIMESGKNKFDFVFPELRAFYNSGAVQINDEEII